MNYALVGGFVLLLGTVLVAVVLWLASGGMLHKQYDVYEAIENESVAGLNLNAPVKYNGVDVGKVTHIALDTTNPQRVHLLFAIEHGTPVKVDTVAVLKTQGLTGISYVELAGGASDAALLPATAQPPYPSIRTAPSLGARLEDVLTAVLTKLDRTSGSVDTLLSNANQAAFKSALADIAVIARTIAARKDTLDAGIVDAARTLDHTALATAKMAAVVDRIGRAAAAIEKLGDDGAKASGSAARVFDAAGADVHRLTEGTLPETQRLLSELNALAASVRRLSEQTERDPASLLRGRGPVADGPGETGATQGTP